VGNSRIDVSTEVTAYTTTTCPHCHRLKVYLARHHIPFENRDVTTDEAAAEELERMNAPGVPVVRVGKQAFGTRPTSGRGLLGQLATRLWDVVQTPRDQADRVLLALPKAGSATEFAAAIYATLRAIARSTGDAVTATLASEHFAEIKQRLSQLADALVPAVLRVARN